MKLSLIVASAILAMGCAAKQPPPKPVEAPIHNATAEDCGHVYERVVAIALVENMDPDKTYSKEEVQAAAVLLDQQFEQTGKKQLFFSYCSTRLNSNQTGCMLGANSFEAMDLCDQLFRAAK